MAVLLGLPWLAAVLGSLFTGLVSFLATYVTKRVALVLAAVAALTSLTVAFIALIEGAAAAFTYTMPSAVAIGMLVPADAPALLAAYAAAKVAFWVYAWNVKIVQMRLF